MNEWCTCSQCGVTKPLTVTHWYENPMRANQVGGRWQKPCKDCWRSNARGKYQTKRVARYDFAPLLACLGPLP